VVDGVVLGQRRDHVGDLVTERATNVAVAHARVLDDVVEQREDLGVLAVAAFAQHVGHGLRTGRALAGGRADAVVGVDEEGDGLGLVAG
jgi:hypothetical protein